MEVLFKNGLDVQRKFETHYLSNNRVEQISWRVSIKYLLTLMYKNKYEATHEYKKATFWTFFLGAYIP